MLTDLLGDMLDQDFGMIRLGQIVVHAQGRECILVIPEDRGAADHEPLSGLGAFDPPTDLDTGEIGEIQVHQGEIERSGVGEALDPFGSVARLDDLESFMTEELGHQSPEDMLVLDEK